MGLLLKLALAFPLPAETPAIPGWRIHIPASPTSLPGKGGDSWVAGQGGTELSEAWPEMVREGFQADMVRIRLLKLNGV